jgi:hypothetical protein
LNTWLFEYLIIFSGVQGIYPLNATNFEIKMW